MGICWFFSWRPEAGTPHNTDSSAAGKGQSSTSVTISTESGNLHIVHYPLLRVSKALENFFFSFRLNFSFNFLWTKKTSALSLRNFVNLLKSYFLVFGKCGTVKTLDSFIFLGILPKYWVCESAHLLLP